MIGLEKYGRDWRKVSTIVKTRNNIQVRTHAQKHFEKIELQERIKAGLPVPAKGKKRKKAAATTVAGGSVAASTAATQAAGNQSGSAAVAAPGLDASAPATQQPGHGALFAASTIVSAGAVKRTAPSKKRQKLYMSI